MGAAGKYSVVNFVTTRVPPDLMMLMARLFLSMPFIIFGTLKYVNRGMMANYVEKAGIPGWFIWFIIPYQILTGLGVALGFQIRLAAFLLGGFCIVATFLYHTQWAFGHKLAGLDDFTKDFAMAGGFLFLWLQGPGRFSIDNYLHKASAVDGAGSVRAPS